MYDQPGPSEDEQDEVPKDQQEQESMAAPGFEDPDAARDQSVEEE